MPDLTGQQHMTQRTLPPSRNTFLAQPLEQPFSSFSLQFILVSLFSWRLCGALLTSVLSPENFFRSTVTPWIKSLPANAGDIRDVGLIPGSGRSPGGGNGNSLQYSCLENPMDRGAWRATVHGITKSQTRLKQLSTSLPGCKAHPGPGHPHCPTTADWQLSLSLDRRESGFHCLPCISTLMLKRQFKLNMFKINLFSPR